MTLALLLGLGVTILAISFVMLIVSAARLLFWIGVGLLGLWPVVIALVLAIAFTSGAHAQQPDPLRAYCSTHSQAACGAYLGAIAQCPQRGAMAFVTLQSIQWWVEKGLTPRQAAQRIFDTTHDYDMTLDALGAEESPGRPSPDDFRKTVLAACFAEAAQ